MNPMLNPFPEAVLIDGIRYPLNTGFRTGLRIMTAYEDPRLTGLEKQMVLCRLLYQSQPPNFAQAVREGVRFLDGGLPAREPKSGRVYSFVQDGPYIYSAMLQTHGIDLQTVEMHWWKFRMLFLDLHADTTFQRMVSLRNRREKGLLTKEDKRLWLDLAELLELREPDPERDRAQAEFEQRMRG